MVSGLSAFPAHRQGNSASAGRSLDPAMMERWEAAYSGLKALILSGELTPGARVREVELAERFRVSRGPIRESLRLLENEGLIVRRARQGSYVTPLNTSDIQEIYELRCAVEPLAIRLSLQRKPESLTSFLRAALDRMRSAYACGKYDVVAAADVELHTQFYEWCGNERVLGVWDSLRSPLQLLVVITGGHDHSDWGAIIDAHQSIVDAAAACDVELCLALETEHLRLAQERASHFRSGSEPG